MWQAPALATGKDRLGSRLVSIQCLNFPLTCEPAQRAGHQRASSVSRVSPVSRSDRMAAIGMPRRHQR